MKRTVLAALTAAAMVGATPAWSVLVDVDPDAFAAGTDISNAFAGVTLATVRTGADVNVPLSVDPVFSVSDGGATTGTRAFGQTAADSTWGNGAFEYLLATFSANVTSVTLDFFANDDGGDAGPQLLAFDEFGNLVDTGQAIFVLAGQSVTLTVNGSIRSVRAYWDEANRQENGGLDHLTFETAAAAVPEPGGLLLAALAGLALLGARGRRVAG